MQLLTRRRVGTTIVEGRSLTDQQRAVAHDGPDLEIVIVTYRCGDLAVDCLQSIKSGLPPSLRYLVHIVDNDSGDGTVSTIRSLFPEVHVLVRPHNDGFGVANNAALRDVTAPTVLVLNPDTKLIPGTVEHLLARLAGDASVGMIGCRLIQADGRFDHAAKRSFPTMLAAGRHLFLPSGRSGTYTAPEVSERGVGDVDAVNGAFMLVRTDAMKQVGYFDEAYWMYGEDLDWCRRFWNAGWRIQYDGTVSALHLKGGVSGRRRSLRLNWHFHRSMAIYYSKHLARRNRLTDIVAYAGIASRFVVVGTRDSLVRSLRRKRNLRVRPMNKIDAPG